MLCRLIYTEIEKTHDSEDDFTDYHKIMVVQSIASSTYYELYEDYHQYDDEDKFYQAISPILPLSDIPKEQPSYMDNSDKIRSLTHGKSDEPINIDLSKYELKQILRYPYKGLSTEPDISRGASDEDYQKLIELCNQEILQQSSINNNNGQTK